MVKKDYVPRPSLYAKQSKEHNKVTDLKQENTTALADKQAVI